MFNCFSQRKKENIGEETKENTEEERIYDKELQLLRHEINLYKLEQPLPPFDNENPTNPLKWWFSKKDSFKRLSLIAECLQFQPLLLQ